MLQAHAHRRTRFEARFRRFMLSESSLPRPLAGIVHVGVNVPGSVNGRLWTPKVVSHPASMKLGLVQVLDNKSQRHPQNWLFGFVSDPNLKVFVVPL
jgi:hypothetical protein